MLKSFTNLVLAAVFCLPASVFAQTPIAKPCGTDKMVKERMQRDPAYAEQVRQNRAHMKALMENPPVGQQKLNTIVIPVVVHVIHDYMSGNISNDQIMDAMRILNEDFNAGSTDLSEIIPAFQPIVGNVGIDFRLAKIDPNGNCTDGITRTYSPLTNSADDNVKDLIRWDPNKYLNVWVVRTISFGAGGYSYYPCPGDDIDGVVVVQSQFGSIGTSSPSTLFRSISHEVGHYLDLPHTWGDSNEPGLPSNCSEDDGIADTPNTIGVNNFSCNTNQVTCGSLDNVQNIMDYSACQIMFTQGQKNRMLQALQLGCRSNLLSQNNLIATGTNDGFVANVCAPIVDFNTTNRVICAGAQVSFKDLSHNATPDTATWTWNWTFTGGTPATSTEQNPVVVYNTPGVYPVTLSVTNPGGTNAKTKNSFVEVRPLITGIAAPYAESFEAAGFPAHPSDAVKNWTIENETTTTWERTPDAAADGSSSVRIRNKSIPVNRENALITPNIDFTGVAQPKVTFKVAYAHSTGTGNDRLRVYYSADCGQNWTMRFAKAGSSLATAPAVSGIFVPGATQWREETVTLPSNIDHMMLKFLCTSSNGSTLYLDAINITGTVTSTPEAGLPTGISVYPNPNNGQAVIKLAGLPAGSATFTITNAIGQQVVNKVLSLEGAQELDLETTAGKKLVPGAYFITIHTSGKVFSQKLIVN